MKAISVHQPYADMIVDGISHKAVENRSWPCSHRGWLLIHASKTKGTARGHGDALIDKRKYGYIIGQVNMFDCLHVNLLRQMLKFKKEPYTTWIDTNRPWHIQGKFCWCFATPRWFKKPFKFKGRQRLFDVPDELLTPEVLYSDLPLFT